MTLENPQNPATSDEPTAKPVRRRATRSAAPPRGVEAVEASTPAAAPAPAPDGDETAQAPGRTVRRTSRRATRSTTTAATVADPVPSEADAEAPSESSGTKAKRTRTTTAKAKAPAKAAPRKKAAGKAEPVDAVAVDAVAPDGGEDASPAPVEKAPARRRATTEVLDVLSELGLPPATKEPAAADDPAPEAGAPKAPARRRASRKAASPAPSTTSEASGDEAPTASTARVAEPPAVVEDAGSPVVEEPAPARTRRRAARRETAPAVPVEVEPEPATTRRKASATTRADGAPRPASSTASTRSADRSSEPSVPAQPRLATTALLFQAPDPAVAPRASRRAQTPAGPPRPAEEVVSVEVERAPEPPTAEREPETAPETESPRARRRSRRAERAAGAVVEALAAVEAEPVVERDLSKEERAAVEEVEAIESELVAEGVELPTDEFGPEDFLGDEDVAEDEEDASEGPRRRRRRGGRGRKPREEQPEDGESDSEDDEPVEDPESTDQDDDSDDQEGGSRRRRRRRRSGRAEGEGPRRSRSLTDEVTALKGSTRLEAKRQRRREGRDAGRRRQTITEAEFLARRESVERSMVVRERDGRTQIAVLEDGVLVEHYVSQQSQASMAGNVYLGRVQNVLPSMEAAFIDVGKGRNAVLYAGEVNWDAAGLEGQPRRIEQALKSGDSVLVQVTKDPIGHKGARLTSQVTLAGRYLVLVPGGGMTGISRKLPDTERSRLKKILRDVVPEGSGVIVRTAAEGASEDELRADVERLQAQWAAIEKKAKSVSAPALLQGEPDLAIRVVRDIFNDDFSSLVVQGDGAWDEISTYVEELAPDLRERVSKWTGNIDLFTVHRVDEQLSKGLDRKVWLPSGGSLVIDRTEAMTVVDVNTGKFTGSGGTLEETVTRNNLEAAEEIVRQLRLRDIGGIIVIDFIDMVLESNRDLVLRRLVECLGRDRTKHQVAEVTSLGLVQMTRKRVGQGLVEAFSETCEHCHGRGFIVHTEPIERQSGNGGPSAPQAPAEEDAPRSKSRRKRAKEATVALPAAAVPVLPDPSSEAREAVKATLATIAAAAAHAHDHPEDGDAPATDVLDGGPLAGDEPDVEDDGTP